MNRNNSIVSISSSRMEEDDNLSITSSCGLLNSNSHPESSLSNSSHNSSTNSLYSNNIRSPNLMSLVHHKWRKMWRRDSAEITPTDPSFKSVYLGNVVTTWAKGEGCLERPASALWKNHCQGRGSIKMVISVAPSGLKAQTREHGLTEYWANRLTWCGVPPDYPKLFCWIYRHEGRKLKQELRCHAVLCTKEFQAQRLANSLRNRLTEALFDFKKEKILRQNARLSIVQSLYNTSATKRKLVLMNSNSQNYKPPLERSKSAPKLSCIEEFEEDENEENFNDSLIESEEHVPVPVSFETLVEFCMSKSNGDIIHTPEESENTLRLQVESEEPCKTSPINHRKSYPCQITHHPEGSRRPHTVPMDAKLNLPYMTGYDKVMQLLDMPAGDTHQLLLDEDDEFSFTGPNSDPVASSPGSDASESPDSSCEDEYGKIIRRRRHSCDKSVGEGSPEEREDEINDNVSDESGYSEEATISRNNSSGNTDLSLKLDPNGSPLLKKSTKNLSTSTIIIGGAEPVIVDGSNKTAMMTTTTFRSDQNGGTTSTTLVVYDNLCFEI